MKTRPQDPVKAATDGQGDYLIYLDKVCSAEGCGVQLTTRNRAGKKLLCKPHASAARATLKRRSDMAERNGTASLNQGIGSMPRVRARLIHAFQTFVTHPADEPIYARLMSAINDYELHERLKRIIPPLPKRPLIGPIPLEEEHPLFEHLTHRTTKNEFLADADFYGA